MVLCLQALLLSEPLRSSRLGRNGLAVISSDVRRQLRSILRSVPAFEKDAMSRHRDYHRREMQPCISQDGLFLANEQICARHAGTIRVLALPRMQHQHPGFPELFLLFGLPFDFPFFFFFVGAIQSAGIWTLERISKMTSPEE